ncbi:1,2-phenylacetyl-CoA epoxidase subunit PaaD [Saccharopolyspora flava]|uniref:Ring-1,2-phenylacetyl-CoA epoxidase subunit PaaD n=1 Tax=Saccharopolyspora flava TaxID=95161 RepID=A0A1I6PR73_9PSEU|nr:1,2-phenylacetyl-CoA epoxidase subunit PaaD [Saccharopolyspora flava]SFS42568.1 ring-1,2-phenylacetyl-CoA epoxidase subunit PaaD [Saccharopolyspora flava]
MSAAPDLVRERVEALPDPELPMITLGELGVIRSARTADDGCVEVEFTPTFLGCPAIPAITEAIADVLADCGHPDGRVRQVLSPAWTPERITAAGRDKLAQHGIAPPGGPTPVGLGLGTPCPHCGSQDTRPHSSFGPTRCQSLLRCARCREIFPCITAM